MVTEENDMRHGLRKMAALLAGALLLTLAGCGQEAAGPENSAGTGGIPAAQTSSEDFQKNMHQSSALRLRRNKLYETEEGIFFQMGSVVRYLDKETKRETILCGKPECTHEDESCNAYLDATNLWMYNGRFYFDNSDYIEENGTFVNKGDRIYSASIDGTDRQVVQYLEFEPGGDTAHAVDPILHRGIVYFGYNGVLYRVPLGEDISKAEKLWGEEILDDGSPFADFNALHLDLWADGDTVYFMANLEQPDGTYKDTLFAYDTAIKETSQVWKTPGADAVGEWETTGVSVTQWYVMDNAIYFFLSGGGLWRGDLSTGENMKLADVQEKVASGTGLFSDDYFLVVNDEPTPQVLGIVDDVTGRNGGDTVYVYRLDGTFVRELSLQSLYDEVEDLLHIQPVCCTGDDFYFEANTVSSEETTDTQNIWSGSHRVRGHILCCLDLNTGEITQIYNYVLGN